MAVFHRNANGMMWLAADPRPGSPFRVTAMQRGYTGPEGTLNYTYYATSELNTVTGARSETYTYDLNGNRTMTGYVTTAGNRLQSDGVYNYTYDNEGNVLTQTRISNGEVFEFTWDYRNRLTKIVLKNSGGTILKEERFTYDVWDRRIGIWLDADGAGAGAAVQKWIVFDGANPYAAFTSSTLDYRYLSGPAIDELFARIGSSNTDWYLGDLLGSVRQIARSDNGTVLDALTYDSYGNTLTETTPSNGDRFGFSGMEDSDIGGPSQQGARYYFSSHGRWANQDPIGLTAGDTNIYRYVGNDPTNFVDATGFQAQPVNKEMMAQYFKDMEEYLNATQSGKEALEYYRKHQNLIKLWVAEYVREERSNKAGEHSVSPVWGVTQPPGSHDHGDKLYHITMAKNMRDAAVHAREAAATFVHEMEHVRNYIENLQRSRDEDEIAATMKDIQFYIQLIEKGKAKFSDIPAYYRERGYVKEEKGKVRVDVDRVKEYRAKYVAEEKKWDKFVINFGKWWYQWFPGKPGS